MYWTITQQKLLLEELITTDKQKVEIIKIGERNKDNGPDFLNGELKINGMHLKGDIEFHLRWQDWYLHGHDHDQRYQHVILHVLWYLPKTIPQKLKIRFPHIVLSQHLQISQEDWLTLMYTLEMDQINLSKHKLIKLPSDNKIKELAWKRFNRKCEEIKSWVNMSDWETSLYLGLAKALGYSKNSKPFVTLIQQYPPAKLLDLVHPLKRSPLTFWILYCYLAGLLNRNIKNQAQEKLAINKTFTDVLADFISKLNAQKLFITQWYFSRLRPLNNPYYRIAGISQILFHYQSCSLFKKIFEIFSMRIPIDELIKKLESTFILKLSEEFKAFFTSFLGYKQIPTYTMGVQRCHQFILNILLPLLYTYAQFTKSFGFNMYIEDLFFNFPNVDDNINSKILNPNLLKSSSFAYFQQGLLEFWIAKRS
jgi:hypothetical protein